LREVPQRLRLLRVTVSVDVPTLVVDGEIPDA
jgi:hypothetical protein